MWKYLVKLSPNKVIYLPPCFLIGGIAKEFSWKTKCGLDVKFGIAPYFAELLNSQSNNLGYFAALFDESFNCVAK